MADIPLPPSLRKRFYEPIVLLDALRSIYLKDNSISNSEPDLEGSSGKSPKQTYFCFLNKLAQICDSHPKQPLGKTVSAVVVLDPGTIEYRLASNQRDSRELEAAREYLTSIITILGHVSDEDVYKKPFMASILSDILQKVLAFNRPRVEDYMEALCRDDRLDFCIRSAAAEGTGDGESAAAALRELQPHLEAAMKATRLNDDEFAHHSEALLQTIDANHESSLEDYMKKKTRGDNTMAGSPWSEVRHALGRLLSYFIAIKVLISARKYWPRLFVDFEVTTIPSSTPLPSPPDIRRSAKGILNRMTSNKTTLKQYQSHATSLQSHGLDERIRQRASPAKFRPIVHAEVALLASVLRSRAQAQREGDDPLRFFNQAEFGAYIGSSKPTCLLCRFYFAAHPSGVGCRASHGNLYYNWRAPDVLAVGGEEEEEEEDGYGGGGEAAAGEDGEGEGEDGPERQRMMILEAMVKEVRKEAGRAIMERSCTRRKHDSWDTPSNPLRSTVRGGSEVDGEWASRRGNVGDGWSTAGFGAAGRVRGEEFVDLAGRMGQVNLDGASTRGSGGGSRDTTPEGLGGGGQGGDDDDEDGGGARL